MLRFNCKLKQIYVWDGNDLRKHTGYVGQILLGVLLCIHIWMGCIGPKGRIYTYRCILLPFVCYPNRFDCYYYYYYQFVICLLSNQIWFSLDGGKSLSLWHLGYWTFAALRKLHVRVNNILVLRIIQCKI